MINRSKHLSHHHKNSKNPRLFSWKLLFGFFFLSRTFVWFLLSNKRSNNLIRCRLECHWRAFHAQCARIEKCSMSLRSPWFHRLCWNVIEKFIHTSSLQDFHPAKSHAIPPDLFLPHSLPFFYSFFFCCFWINKLVHIVFLFCLPIRSFVGILADNFNRQ